MFKKMILTLFCCLFCLFCSAAYAYEPVKFQWTCNTEVELAGYKIYWNVSDDKIGGMIDVGMAEVDEDGNCYFAIQDPPPKLNIYRITAYDEDGFGSDYSENAPEWRTRLSLVEDFNCSSNGVTINININGQ